MLKQQGIKLNWAVFSSLKNALCKKKFRHIKFVIYVWSTKCG
jgi:hypothetical protein